MESFLQDLRYAIRVLRKNRTLTFVALVSIALGIGANTAVFSAVNTVLLSALPYASVDRLVLVWAKAQSHGILSDRDQVSATDVADFRAQNTVFEDMATFTGWVPLLSGYGETERIPAIQVGDGFFRVMDGKPLLGRTFLPEEQQDGKDFVIILGYGLWQRKFGSDPQIVGKTVLLNSKPYTIVGVMPPDFRPLPTSLVIPEGQFYRPVAEAYDNNERDSRHLRAVARLKPGVTLEQAQTEMSVIAGRLEKQYPKSNTDISVNLVSLTEDTVGGIRRSLWVLFGAVTFVLLIACANVSNLLLAQSAARQREITLRAALGASRWTLIRQLLTESMLLSVAGGLLGLLLAYWGALLIAKLGPQIHPLLASARLDARVLGFTTLLSLLAGILFGMAPAWHSSRTELSESLKTSGQNTAAATPAANRLRGMLIAGEIAVTLVLLMCAALFLQTVVRLRRVDPGFHPDHLLTMSIGLPLARYPKPKDQIAFYTRALDGMQSVPGVKTAGLVSVLPLSDNFDGRGIVVEDHPRPVGQELSADMYVVSPGYLTAMEIQVLRGRGITEQDTADAFKVALINETMARQLWNGADPLGKRIRFDGEKDKWRTIVGVVKDVQQYALDRKPPMQFYLPFEQFPTFINSLVVKTESDPVAMAATIRNEIRALDSQQAVYNLTTMEQLVSDSIALRRLLMDLLMTLAIVALVMAAAGIYGVMAYTVTRKTREIGVRMALGANRSDVFRLVVRQGLILTFAGLAAGTLGAAAATHTIRGLLFETSPTNPLAFLLVASLLSVAALAACLAPARRAAAMDPLEAIRYE